MACTNGSLWYVPLPVFEMEVNRKSQKLPPIEKNGVKKQPFTPMYTLQFVYMLFTYGIRSLFV